MRTREGIAPKRFIAKMLLVSLLVAFVGCGVPGADGPADSFGVDFSMEADSEVSGAIFFVVDGVSGEVFAQMLAEGELPALQKYFVDRGLYARRAVASTPSVTLANEVSLITGRFPGHHGVTGINWFDRNRLLFRDYETISQKNRLDDDYRVETIFDQFPDISTFSLFLQAHRGASKFFENRISAGPAYFFGMFELTDRISLYRFGEVMEMARQRKRFPGLIVAYMLAPDFQAYTNGAGSEEYRQALAHTDRQIGRVLSDLERAGLLEKVVIALATDHSMIDVTKHFPLTQFLTTEIGLDVASRRLWEKQPYEKRMAYYRKFPAVLYGSGCRYWALCLRRPVAAGESAEGYHPWPMRPTPEDLVNYPTASGPTNLIDRFVAVEAIDAVAWGVGPNRVRVARRGGQVEFRQKTGPGGRISYHRIGGADPLGWDGRVPAGMLSGALYDGRAWLTATADTDFPDLPAQILAYFRTPRAGDVAIFAAPGWDCNSTLRAGHGGLRPGDLCTPMLLAGPGVPKDTLDVVRTVDMVPTLLNLLDRPIPEGLDGRSLLPQR